MGAAVSCEIPFVTTSGEVSCGEKVSILGPTQGRISPSILQNTKGKKVRVVRGVPNRVLDSADERLHQSQGVQRSLLGLEIQGLAFERRNFVFLKKKVNKGLSNQQMSLY